MKFKTYLFLSLGISLSQSTMAESFTETFHGAPKLNLNLYAFGADVDGKIRLGDIVICTQKLKYEVNFQKSDLETVLYSWLVHGVENLLK